VLDEAFLDVGGPSESDPATGSVGYTGTARGIWLTLLIFIPGVFFHIAPALKRFALRSPRDKGQSRDRWDYWGGGGYGSKKSRNPTMPSDEERRLNWAINCIGLNEIHLIMDKSQRELLNRAIGQCPELQTVIINPVQSSTFVRRRPFEWTAEIVLPEEKNQVANLGLLNIALSAQCRIQGEKIVTLNLRDCDLTSVFEQFLSSGATSSAIPRRSEFFECIGQGCPSLKHLLFTWIAPNATDPERWTIPLSGSILPVLPFPNLETLAVISHDVTNADLVQIATNCHNLRQLVIHSGIDSNSLTTSNEIDEEEKRRSGRLQETGISMPNLERLHLQSVLCTDAVLSALVMSAPKLRVLVHPQTRLKL
jgi:hypothetical protein